jgi:hypothetical protein
MKPLIRYGVLRIIVEVFYLFATIYLVLFVLFAILLLLGVGNSGVSIQGPAFLFITFLCILWFPLRFIRPKIRAKFELYQYRYKKARQQTIRDEYRKARQSAAKNARRGEIDLG